MTHILLIEDNLDIREITAEILELEGYKVTVAKDGEEGVEKANTVKPDLILCDIMMPKLDGYGVFNALQAQETTMGIPFVFLTAKSEKTDFRRGMNLGADDYIIKPFEPEDIFKVIETRLQKTKSLKAIYKKDLSNIHQFMQDASHQLKIEDLTKTTEIKKIKNKELLFKEGKPATHLYFIVSGNVKTYKITETAKEFVSGIFGKGEFIGQLSLLSQTGKYINTAMVMEQAEVCAIPKDNFIKLIYDNKTVSQQFIEMLSNNLISSQENLFDMAFAPVRKRAAKALLQLFEKGILAGTNEKGINIPREDFAGMIGTAIETSIRTLKDFKKEKIITIENGKHFILLDKKKLQDISNF